MKNISLFLLMIIAVMGLSSCQHDDDVVFVAQPDPEGVAFTSTFSDNYTLTQSTSGNLAERFVWNEVDFGAPTTVTYELQGSASQDFSSFDVIGTTSETNLGVKVSQMMSLAEDAGLDNDPNTENPNTGTIYFRVKAYAGNDGGNSLNATSEVASLTVTLPEEGEQEMPKTNLFLVGDATAAGWDPNNNNTPLFRDAENENMYYFTGYFAAGYYKFVETTNWAPMYGYDGSTLVYRATESDPDPASIEVATAGYYSLALNTDDLTFSMDSYDASGATTYTTIGIIGTATPGGWDADTDMTQSTFDPHIWFMNDAELVEGEMKFRAENDWAVNWGTDSAESGQAAQDGANIPVMPGTYDIWFNDLDGRYILIPQVTE
ncbi:MAG: SusF/SusE family outer membrane protein [Bacteroidota bacterium]|uniref:SusF/SusE family outer membrane protein n=1 Tax=Christiangramia sp. TaxID=1931228 RepID=UPI002E8D82E0|nr:SusF/SusE family outer membrane protein [Bacteroidota bacterium]